MERNEGWGFVGGSWKRHYFVDNKSLCGVYTIFDDGQLIRGGAHSANDCAACQLQLDMQRKLTVKIERPAGQKAMVPGE